eukprot:352397-Prorocentrum_minimum.AAC.2
MELDVIIMGLTGAPPAEDSLQDSSRPAVVEPTPAADAAPCPGAAADVKPNVSESGTAAPPPRVKPRSGEESVGKRVQLTGLVSAAHLNGGVGECSAYDAASGRVTVRLEGVADEQFKVVKVKLDNVLLAPAPPPRPAGGPGGGSSPKRKRGEAAPASNKENIPPGPRAGPGGLNVKTTRGQRAGREAKREAMANMRAGCDVNKEDTEGLTPLLIAAVKDHVEFGSTDRAREIVVMRAPLSSRIGYARIPSIG